MRRLRRPRHLLLALLSLFLLASGLTLSGAGSAAQADTPWWEPENRPLPDAKITVEGEPFRGTDEQGRVRGFVDAHNHLFSDEGFGGRLICGKVFSEKGVTEALKDCPEHYPDGGGALFENVTGGADGHHDPVGWPTFSHWPKYNSLSHQQNYYAWVERAWRGGQRVLVNDLVSNGLLCSVYPAKDRGCDEMDAIRLQARKSYELQDYVDTMYGGPGKGWFRIVTDSAQARKVVEQGKLAVVLGVETSEPFGCKQVLDVAQCDEKDIDQGLDELHDLGVRSMFLCHKFDNALCGVRFDSGTTGVAVNAGQFLSTGTFWQTGKCEGPQHDNPIGLAKTPKEVAERLPAGVTMPSYDEEARCNTRGLSRLGEYAMRGMMDRQMMLEIDHMSVRAAGRALDIAESEAYPGIISSHSWMDTEWTERVYRLGGFVAQYMHGSEQFTEEGRRTAALRDKYEVGYGYGTDMNGVGGSPAPRGADAPNQVEYPFRTVDGGSVVDKPVTGERTWDINKDGVAHNGMVPDWIEDIRRTGGKDVVDDLFLGADSYLRTLGATEGHRSGSNLAAQAPVRASSTQWSLNGKYEARGSVDSDTGTRWSSSWGKDDQWLEIDLRRPSEVGKVVLDWEQAHARGYRIELSDNGRDWRTVWSTDKADGGIDSARFTPATARYVRVHGTERATRYGYSLYEVGAYGR